MDDLFLAVIIAAFVGLRVFFGYLIGSAANRRNYGNTGWMISSLIIGPLIVWIIYLLFVSWRPIVLAPDRIVER
jgi:hypothetical protein